MKFLWNWASPFLGELTSTNVTWISNDDNKECNTVYISHSQDVFTKPLPSSSETKKATKTMTLEEQNYIFPTKDFPPEENI